MRKTHDEGGQRQKRSPGGTKNELSAITPSSKLKNKRGTGLAELAKKCLKDLRGKWNPHESRWSPPFSGPSQETPLRVCAAERGKEINAPPRGGKVTWLNQKVGAGG